MNSNYKIFTTTWFLLGLSLLLLNDFVLKELLGNWFTGKLSDFAGLFIFPLFWTAFFPRQKKSIFIFTGLLFILWKSPLSQHLIDSWNSFDVFYISRVVDYTDLIALSILPLAFYLESNKLHLTSVQTRPIFPIVITAFAFGATSYSSQVEVNKPYTVNAPKDSIVNRIQRLDSVYLLNPSQPSVANRDTIWLSIPNDICQGFVEAKISFEKHQDTSTTITLLNTRYSCPKGGNDKKNIVTSFKEKIIDQIDF